MELKIQTKYNNVIELDVYKEQLVKSIFKLLPLREEKKDWQKFLTGLQVELAGMKSLTADFSFDEDINFITLIAKLEGLFEIYEDQDLYRKTVFDSINLVKKL